MSQMMAEAPAGPAAPAAPRSKPGVLTRKVGILPVWAWGAAAFAAALAFWQYRKGSTSAASSGASTATATTAAGGPYGSLASQVPQFVNQTYLNPTPPSAQAPQAPPTPPPAPAHASNPATPLKAEGQGKARVGSASDLYYIARRLGISETVLVKSNPKLKGYVGTGHGVPAGTIINLPKGAKV